MGAFGGAWNTGRREWITGAPVEQTQRWCAAALLLIEPRLRKVKGYRHLPRLVEALCRANTTQVDVA